MIPVAAYIAAGALVVGAAGGWAANGWRLGSTIANMKAEAEGQKAKHKAQETEWGKATLKIMEDSYAEAETLRGALARADAAGRSLHDARGSRAAEAATAAGPGSTAAATVLLLAELHRELDDFAGEAARSADAARAAGLICERADEVTR